jgi:hypothetical protein
MILATTEGTPVPTGHRTIRLKIGEQEANIDVGIADIVEQIWLAGIATVGSCEDNEPPGYCWIEFITADDAENFVEIVARSAPRSLKYRIWEALDKPGAWIYDPVSDLVEGPVSFFISVSVRFPRRDRHMILAALKQHNAALICHQDS